MNYLQLAATLCIFFSKPVTGLDAYHCHVPHNWHSIPDGTVCELEWNGVNEVEIDCEFERWDKRKACTFPLTTLKDCYCLKEDCLHLIGVIEDEEHLQVFEEEHHHVIETVDITSKEVTHHDLLELESEIHNILLAISSYITGTIVWLFRSRNLLVSNASFLGI